jgi:hypothetical protein
LNQSLHALQVRGTREALLESVRPLSGFVGASEPDQRVDGNHLPLLDELAVCEPLLVALEQVQRSTRIARQESLGLP